MKITKRQLRQIIKENTQASSLTSNTRPGIQKMVSNSYRQQQLQEYYPVGGEDASPKWGAFLDAAWGAASEKIDAGMEADGVMEAMKDDIEQMINEMEGKWDDADENYDGGEEWAATGY